LELFLKPVYEDKIGLFVDLGSILFLQDGAHNRRGFPSHILSAFGESMVKRDDGYNAEQNAVLPHLGVTPPNFREHQHALLGGATASVS
jgi:hypothetical protein